MSGRAALGRLATCRHCGGPIVWATLDTGSSIPLDPLPNPFKGNVAVRPDTRGRLRGHVIARDRPAGPGHLIAVPHVATCPARPAAPPKPPPPPTLWSQP